MYHRNPGIARSAVSEGDHVSQVYQYLSQQRRGGEYRDFQVRRSSNKRTKWQEIGCHKLGKHFRKDRRSQVPG